MKTLWFVLCISPFLHGFAQSADLLGRDPAEVIQQTSQIATEPDEDVLCLLDETEVAFDASGKRTTVYRQQYKILAASAVEDWSTIEQEYAPWYEERPTLKARVIGPDGGIHLLEESTIDDSPAEEYYEDTYSDRRIVHAPLPAIVVGAIVEQEVTVKEIRPLSSAATQQTLAFGRYLPVEKFRVVLNYPEKLPLKIIQKLLPDLTPTRTSRDGFVQLVFEANHLSKLKSIVSYLPPDEPRWPYIAYSTGTSWQSIAAEYHEIVEEKITGSALKEFMGHGATKKPDKIETLLAELSRQVRYTGLEFGESSIVPHTPKEILERKYGDCKDKAALLVALLRQSGWNANVALLRTGPRKDIDPELPGIGAFDHAIVYVQGEQPVWIDPTDPYARAGELPAQDQGRYALIIDPQTTQLTRTPLATPETNRIVETREFEMQEDGPARLIETTELFGSFERQYRHTYSERKEKDLRETLDDYVKRTFLAKKLDKMEYSKPDDLSGPFRVRLEAGQAARGATDETEAVVVIFLGSIADDLPEILLPDSESTDEPESEEPQKREKDLMLSIPFVREWRYQIQLPPGFAATELPQSDEIQIGPTKLTRTFALQKDGRATATFRYDVVKARFTPAECDAIQTALKKLEDEDPLILRFPQKGKALLDAGNYREALDEYKHLASLHPKEAIHQRQMALVFLASGMGMEARNVAENAARVDPSTIAFRTLGWVYEHDEIGRRYKKGFDLQKSAAAYRKAIALDPKEVLPHAELAILLEHNAEGKRYAQGADLAGSIKEYLYLRNELKNTHLDKNLLFCYLWAREFDKLKEFALTLPQDNVRDEFVILATAAGESAEAGIRQASRLVSDLNTRRSILRESSGLLIQLRIYPQGLALLKEATKGSELTAALKTQLEVLQRVQQWNALSFPENDPASVAKKLIITMIQNPTLKEESIAPFFIKDFAEELKKPENLRLMEATIRSVRQDKFPQEFPTDVLLDLAFSNLEFAKDGDDASAYKIQMKTTAGPQELGSQRFYVVREDGAYKIAAAGAFLGTLAPWAMHLAESGNLQGARKILDWAREDAGYLDPEDPLSADPLIWFWKGGQEGDLAAVHIASSILLARSDHVSDSIPLLLKIREGLPPADQEHLDTALVRAYESIKDYAAAQQIVTRLLERYPDSRSLFYEEASLLEKLKRWDDLNKFADDKKAIRDIRTPALHVLAQVSEWRGDLVTSEKLYHEILESGKPVPSDYNLIAWIGLFEETRPEHLQYAQKAVALTNEKSDIYLHTLACLYAAKGDLKEARDTIMKSLEVSAEEEPHDYDWYVFGLIAEKLGLKEAAVNAYTQVKPPEESAPLSTSTYRLAQLRLTSLKK